MLRAMYSAQPFQNQPLRPLSNGSGMLSGFLLKLVTFRSRTEKKGETELLIIGKDKIWSIGKEGRLLWYIFFNLSTATGVFERGRREQCLEFHFEP